MKGILFKPWKIAAIAKSGTDFEWQTRRVIKPQPFLGNKFQNYEPLVGKSRYQFGETVYIKEACCRECQGIDGIEDACYKTDEDNGNDILINCLQVKWRSPLFMPAWAARYFIKITDVRPERLQEITPKDCLAEGIEPNFVEPSIEGRNFWDTEMLGYFERLWDSINPKYPWASNCWVWVYSFKFTPEGRD